MDFSRRNFLAAAGAASTLAFAPRAFAAPAGGQEPALLKQALAAMNRHGTKIRNREIMGLVDFSQHSSKARMSIVHPGSGRVISSHLVSHGKGSDPNHTGWLKKFSNRPGSNASSQGSFLVGESYVGKHGRSRRLHGLDAANALAFERAIVMHGASYANRSVVSSTGKLGRSLGCFAHPTSEIEEIMRKLTPGTLLFAAA